MKPFADLVAERPVARHCAELVRPAAPADQLVPALCGVGDRLARALGAGLAPLVGAVPTVRAQPARLSDELELTATIAPLAANAMLAVKGAQVLLSIEACPVLRLVDRAFGGRGEEPAKLPDAFPLSAELMIARMETAICAAFAAAIDADRPPAIDVAARSGRYEDIARYAMDDPLALLSIEVEEPAGKPWSITLVVQVDELPALLGERLGEAPGGPRAARHPADEPFGEIALPVSAVLVDMMLPFPTVAQLRPGAVLPVAVARAVPLRVGESTIAHGSPGALDDRVAIQLSRVFQN